MAFTLDKQKILKKNKHMIKVLYSLITSTI